MKLKEANALQDQDLPTGIFSSWLCRTRRAQKTTDGADVPCGDCRACCTSSYFIHIKPDETQTLARIPIELLFAAPGLPKGNVLLGYEEQGHCPMFIDNQCSIYELRPQTCRDYDCRIFAATGLTAGDDKAMISQQARRWKFDFPTAKDEEQFTALKAAAKFLSDHAERFPAGFIPSNTTQRAVLAIKVYEVFLDSANIPQNDERPDHIQEIVKKVVAAHERFIS
jgi:uncharacterized protein